MVTGSDNSVTAGPKKGLFRPQLIYPLIAAGLVIAVVLSFGGNILVPRLQKEAPERLGDLELIGAFTGAEAITRVNQLHGLDVSLSGALIAAYTHSSPYHGNSRATVWVGRVASAEVAAGLTQRMAQSIAEGSSPFNNLRTITVGGLAVFQVDGPGGKHYFYRSKKEPESVVWLNIEASDPIPVLEEATKTF